MVSASYSCVLDSIVSLFKVQVLRALTRLQLVVELLLVNFDEVMVHLFHRLLALFFKNFVVVFERADVISLLRAERSFRPRRSKGAVVAS